LEFVEKLLWIGYNKGSFLKIKKLGYNHVDFSLYYFQN
jgi:hypothetical protein